MQERHIQFTPKNIIYYLFGFFMIGLGVLFMLRSSLGAGAWDTVTANLNAYLVYLDIPVSLGLTSILITSTLFLFVLLYTRNKKLLYSIIPIILIGLVIDFWDIIVFQNYYPSLLLLKFLFFILGALFIPLGLAMVVSSHFPASVFDELMIVIMDIFKTKSIVKARLGLELGGVFLGSIFGFLAGIGFGAVNIGSVVMAFILPPIFNYFIRKLGAFDE